MEELRQELIEVIDERLDETELMLFARADQQFHFARSVIVVFDTHQRLAHPRELVDVLPEMSVGSIFYHFVDARRREPVGWTTSGPGSWAWGPSTRRSCDASGRGRSLLRVALRAPDRLAELFARAIFGARLPRRRADAAAPRGGLTMTGRARRSSLLDRYAEHAGHDAVEQLRQLAGPLPG